MEITPVTLTGRHVRLEPLSPDHLDRLCEVGLEESLWRWTVATLQTVADMEEYVATALRARAEGSALPFVMIEQASGRIVGSTRYGNIDLDNLRLEIGWTWIAPAWQRTVINTEAKYLMLRQAFEILGCNRVEFKTDSLNEKSRRALLRIGATEEGVFRNHMIVQGGRLRHSVFFSIIKSEWPTIKANLEAKLEQ